VFCVLIFYEIFIQSTPDIRYLQKSPQAVSYIGEYVISGVNFKGFLIVWAKFGVCYIGGILYRELTVTLTNF
jgi:hypothetical protein